jgi:hypothetical protein
MKNIDFCHMELQQVNHKMYRTLRPFSNPSFTIHMNTVIEIKQHTGKETNLLPSTTLGMNLGTNRRPDR